MNFQVGDVVRVVGYDYSPDSVWENKVGTIVSIDSEDNFHTIDFEIGKGAFESKYLEYYHEDLVGKHVHVTVPRGGGTIGWNGINGTVMYKDTENGFYYVLPDDEFKRAVVGCGVLPDGTGGFPRHRLVVLEEPPQHKPEIVSSLQRRVLPCGP